MTTISVIQGTPNPPKQDLAWTADGNCTLSNPVQSLHLTASGVVTLPPNPQVDQKHRLVIGAAATATLAGNGHPIAGGVTGALPNTTLDLTFSVEGLWVPSAGAAGAAGSAGLIKFSGKIPPQSTVFLADTGVDELVDENTDIDYPIAARRPLTAMAVSLMTVIPDGRTIEVTVTRGGSDTGLTVTFDSTMPLFHVLTVESNEVFEAEDTLDVRATNDSPTGADLAVSGTIAVAA